MDRGLLALRFHDLIGPRRFPRQQRRRQAHPHRAAVQGVGQGPAQALGDDEDQGFSREQRPAEPERIGGGQEAQLLGTRSALDAPGIDHRILGGAEKTGQDRKDGEPRDVRFRIGSRHAQQSGHDADLAERHPAPPPAENAEHGQLEPVDRRAPDELQDVGHAGP